MTKVATTSSCRLSTVADGEQLCPEGSSKIPSWIPSGLAWLSAFTQISRLSQGHTGSSWSSLGEVAIPSAMDRPALPTPYPSLIKRGSEVALHGNTTLPKICIHICSHSRRAKRVCFFRFQNQGLNELLHQQRKDFLLWLQSRVSCAAKDLRMKTELNCYIL